MSQSSYTMAALAGRRRRHVLLAALAASLVPMAAPGAGQGLEISNAWMRLIIPSRPAAGYFKLTNGTDTAVTLVGASSPACASLMLHRSVSQGGQDRMVMVHSIPVAAHDSVTFAPGGYHLMCMQPSAAVTPGKAVEVTLEFKGGASLSASFEVRNAMGK